MAMICALCVTHNPILRLSLVVNGVLGLAILSLGLPWLVILLALSLCFHLWQAFRTTNWLAIILSVASAILFAVLYSAHLLLDIALYWLVFSVVILSISGFFNYEEPEDEELVEVEVEPLYHDELDATPLTGLPDRNALRNSFVAWTEEHSANCALVMIRLEGFNDVNQHIGRDFGDLLLAQSATRIKQQLNVNAVLSVASNTGSAEKLAHLGGLNFAFICSLEEQKHLHEQLISQIRQVTLKPFNVANCTIEVKVRASYVNCDEPDYSFENLISFANLALDSNPERAIVPYHPQMMIEQLEQQARLRELAHLDFASELELYFQPVIRNSDEQIEFLELLLRWQHPKQGILSANKFIDDIRVAGLSYPVAAYVIERAAELAMALRMEGIELPLSINVFGPEMLHEEFIEFVDRIMAEHRLEPGDLIIECPLDLFMNLDEQGKAMVARLSSIGIKLCIDGFGDTPIWLAKLPNLNVEYIKVAASLTADFAHQSQVRSLVSGMVDMHSQNNAKVICEGVETIEQLKFVKSLNTYAAQGYYFNYPLSSVGMMSWLKQWRLEHQG
ncbi:GGDEF domain-containing phosphodiesterase [Pseudoalteromonas shioyasakiensis]|uniref:GGDEF domain-containing phosphodiesterase n=1 Tax=Pseudoalteromonas shioyasakiensis TaxID=1190813 RepID=UPI0021190852|nr:GGDEF domain-containing phosphodiesterase [Pseudoalteromonas shioyasakiensis]MCQ8883011.1 GGDEF domain-containing phosphodiesterase [Pseudoalteromonas shioyasakiensis]